MGEILQPQLRRATLRWTIALGIALGAGSLGAAHSHDARASSAYNHPATQSAVAAGSQLVFDDEFSGTGLDTSQWIALNRPGDSSNSEQECYRPSNATVSGGALLITDRLDSSCAGYRYTSAMIQPSAFNFTYGTFEVRARMPSGQGQWPALWLLGANCQQPNITSPDNIGRCQWPMPGSNEIDLFEGQNTSTTTGFFNLHTGTGANNDDQHFACNGVSLPFDTSTGYHTYDLIWQPKSLVWQIDGHTYCSTSTNVPNTAMFPILNIAVGGDFVGQSVDTSAMPQTLSVDYVRVYQQGAASTATATATSTAVPPTATATRTSTPIAPTATGTAARASATATPPVSASTATPIPPTATSTPTVIKSRLGYTSIGGTLDTGDANFMNGSWVVIGSQAKTVQSVSAYIGPVDAAPHNQFAFAIYADNNGAPGALVARSTSGTLHGRSWNTLPLNATLSPNRAYWLIYNTNGSDSTVNNMAYDNAVSNAGAYSTNAQGFGTWPAGFGHAALGGWRYSLYATVSP